MKILNEFLLYKEGFAQLVRGEAFVIKEIIGCSNFVRNTVTRTFLHQSLFQSCRVYHHVAFFFNLALGKCTRHTNQEFSKSKFVPLNVTELRSKDVM